MAPVDFVPLNVSQGEQAKVAKQHLGGNRLHVVLMQTQARAARHRAERVQVQAIRRRRARKHLPVELPRCFKVRLQLVTRAGAALLIDCGARTRRLGGVLVLFRALGRSLFQSPRNLAVQAPQTLVQPVAQHLRKVVLLHELLEGPSGALYQVKHGCYGPSPLPHLASPALSHALRAPRSPRDARTAATAVPLPGRRSLSNPGAQLRPVRPHPLAPRRRLCLRLISRLPWTTLVTRLELGRPWWMIPLAGRGEERVGRTALGRTNLCLRRRRCFGL
mmetsp:Transcript_20980/g.39892  ORF Transcript_20980/g.39892 Transcript_20980/m.39892 type:complete len:276 (-) Transcript_20980:73-900(-)